MKLNPDDLRRHYASLSDEALRAIDRTELVDIARECYDHELAQREPIKKRPGTVPRPSMRVKEPDVEDEPAPGEEWEDEASGGDEEPPEWIADADCVCTFPSRPGSNAASDADNVRAVLTDAEIPCYVAVRTLEPDIAPASLTEYRVVVPGGMNLEATSVLDKEIYNAEIEAEWRNHFAVLTDEEFFGVNKEILFGGLEDRIERIRRAYDEEVARRSKTSYQQP